METIQEFAKNYAYKHIYNAVLAGVEYHSEIMGSDKIIQMIRDSKSNAEARRIIKTVKINMTETEDSLYTNDEVKRIIFDALRNFDLRNGRIELEKWFNNYKKK
jgi:uncharacterized protein YaiL (DUF2058 family)